jgi:hypothetical protein
MLVAHALREMRAAIAEKLTGPGEDVENCVRNSRLVPHDVALRLDLEIKRRSGGLPTDVALETSLRSRLRMR